MTQIAQKYKNDAPRLESALDSITNEGNYLLVLINSILDVNQLEHGHMELNKAPFDAVRCAADSVELLRPLADKKAQTMALHCDKSDCVVVGDVNRYSQIMINIISNAIKYTPVGGEITVRLDCLPGGRVIFRCTDTGIGMAPEFIGHITEDCVRAEDGQKAVELFEKSAPGSYFAVFMDMQMPVMDGVEATRRIRASDRPDHDVPIFAMTANTFAADRKKCYDAGMSGYIPKPIDLETITHVLEEETDE